MMRAIARIQIGPALWLEADLVGEALRWSTYHEDLVSCRLPATDDEIGLGDQAIWWGQACKHFGLELGDDLELLDCEQIPLVIRRVVDGDCWRLSYEWPWDASGGECVPTDQITADFVGRLLGNDQTVNA